jgi:hypothetical protein
MALFVSSLTFEIKNKKEKMMLEFNVLLTSFYAARKYELENKFSVACWKPDWCTYKDLEFLFPRDVNGIRLRLRNCNNSIEQYIEELRNGYSDRWEVIETWLENLKKDEQVILCCWCPNSSSSKEQLEKYGVFFCHTTLIGKMLRIHRPDLIVKLDYAREIQSVSNTIDWYKIELVKIISGGQTGADQAGLFAAKDLSLQTGGWMPKGFRTLEGSRKDFKEKFNIDEHSSFYYPPRTFQNAKESDATVRFATDFNSSGELCTLKAITQYKKPYFDVDVSKQFEEQVKQFRSWLKCNRVKVLNVAGNSEKTSPGIFNKTVEFLKMSLNDL